MVYQTYYRSVRELSVLTIWQVLSCHAGLTAVIPLQQAVRA